MIEKAINRYGQLSLWKKIDHITIDINSIGGIIPKLKGIGRTFPHFGRVCVFPHELRVVFFDRGGAELGFFEAGAVALKNQKPIENYRLKFRGLSKYRRWNLADAIYFFGYAIATYTGIPFILENIIEKEQAWGEGFRIDAKFPDHFHTHSLRQSFYFSKEGLLVRHDYHAEILGWFAYGAHLTSDFKEMNGFPIARCRQVYARIGNLVTPVPVLQASLEPVDVVLN